mgnify:CR=1
YSVKFVYSTSSSSSYLFELLYVNSIRPVIVSKTEFIGADDNSVYGVCQYGLQIYSFTNSVISTIGSLWRTRLWQDIKQTL